MSHFNENYKNIEDYLHGHLSGDPLKAFEERMLTDSEFADEVKLHQLAEEVIVDYKLNDLRKELKEIAAQSNSNSSSWKLYSAGLIILTISSIAYFTSNRTTQEIPSQNKISLPIEEKPSVNKISPNNYSPISILPQKQKVAVSSEQNYSIQLAEGRESFSVAPIDSLALSNTALLPDDNIDFENKVKEADSNPSVDVNDNICENIFIESTIQAKATCKEKTEGELLIDSYSLKGGNAPYLFSLNDIDFQSGFYFTQLSSGSYTLTIKDSRNCTSKKEFRIEETDCKTEHAFNPSLGEVWVPPTDDSDQFIKIVDQSGNTVFNRQLQSGTNTFWDGHTNNNQELPMGNYSYIITGKNGKTKAGYITIFR